jgi:cold shock protein
MRSLGPSNVEIVVFVSVRIGEGAASSRLEPRPTLRTGTFRVWLTTTVAVPEPFAGSTARKAGASSTPGECMESSFMLFSNIAGVGYRRLRDGQDMTFTYEAPGFKQDGYDFRAVLVWPTE